MVRPSGKYDEYKDTKLEWLGLIPSHWRLERAKYNFSLSNERGNDSPVLLAATQKFGMIPQDDLEGVVKVAEGTDLQQFRTVHKYDFVISLRSFQGGFELSEYEGVCSPAYQVFSIVNSYSHEYLRYLFKSELFIDAMNALTVGIREGRNIKYSDFANSYLPVPPVKEQEAISEWLTIFVREIDELIDEEKESIEQYSEWKKAVIRDSVSKGVNNDVKMKNSFSENIGCIPEGWNVIRFKYLLDVKSGDAVRNEDLTDEGKCPVYGGGERIGFTDKSNCKKGDILIGRVGARCGYTTLVVTDSWATDNALIIQSKIDCEYLYYLLVAADLNSLNMSNAQPLITGSKIKNCCSPYTSNVSEQKEIVSFLNKQCSLIDGVISEKIKLIEDMEKYRKAVIYETVTGKRKVV